MDSGSRDENRHNKSRAGSDFIRTGSVSEDWRRLLHRYVSAFNHIMPFGTLGVEKFFRISRAAADRLHRDLGERRLHLRHRQHRVDLAIEEFDDLRRRLRRRHDREPGGRFE